MSIQAPIRNNVIYEPGQAPALARLLAEYTENLRNDCDKLEINYQRKTIFTAVLMMFATIYGAVMSYAIGEIFRPPHRSLPFDTVLTIRIIIVVLICTSIFWLVKEIINVWRSVQKSLRPSRLQITASTAQLERLVRRTSPIAEHSNLSLSEKLELDLRLADADAALEHAAQYIGKGKKQVNTVNCTEFV